MGLLSTECPSAPGMWASVLGPGPTRACPPCPVHFAPSRRAEEGVAFLQKGSGVELDTTGSFLVGACSSQPRSLAVSGQSSPPSLDPWQSQGNPLLRIPTSAPFPCSALCGSQSLCTQHCLVLLGSEGFKGPVSSQVVGGVGDSDPSLCSDVRKQLR